ncbi:MAG: metallophosphoesterase [Bacteroidota bacterium]
MKVQGFLVVFVGLLGLFACTEKTLSNNKHYLFIGHAYQWGAPAGDKVDRRLEQLPLDDYDQIWLGGDLCNRSSRSPSTLSYLDSLFHISHSSTHWALGNHDLIEGKAEYIRQATGRPTFYTDSFDGICLFVLNTNFNHPQLSRDGDDCPEQNEQYRLLSSVLDSIQHSSHLILLHHHNLLTDSIARHEVNMNLTCNFYRDALPFSCDTAGSFQQLIYPQLAKVQQRGVQVILIGGDFGQRHKGFQYQTAEGIWFLGSGINNSMGRKYIPAYVTNLNRDSLLRFQHSPAERRLTWEFFPLERYVH